MFLSFLKKTKPFFFREFLSGEGRFFPLLSLLGLACASVGLCFTRLWNYDLWWHLATGRWILEHRAIPHADPFSYTFHGKPWVDALWLFQVIVWKAYKLLGFSGLSLISGILSLLVLSGLYLAARSWGGGRFLSLVLVFISLWPLSIRLFLRPHLPSLFFFVLFLWGIGRFREDRRWSSLLPLLPIFLFWVNTHGSFILGFGLALFLFLEGVFSHPKLSPSEAFRLPEVRRPFLFGLALLFLSLVNPYGFKLLEFVFFSHRGAGEEPLRFIIEWWPIELLAFLLPPVQSALFGSRLSILPILTWLLVGGIVLGSSRLRSGRFVWLIWLAALFYLSSKHHRFLPWLILSIVPFLALLWEGVKREVKQAVSVALVLLSLGFTVAFWLSPANRSQVGVGVAWENFPQDLVSLVKSHHFPGPMFNQYYLGGYLIFSLYPEYQVFIDGRTPSLYSPNFYWRYRMALKAPELFFEHLNEWSFGFFLFDRTRKPLARYLKEKGDYALVAFDDRYLLFVKREALPEGLKPLEHLTPWEDQEPEDEDPALLREELELACERAPHAVFPLVRLAALETRLKNHEEAREILLKALNLSGNRALVLKNLGIVSYNLNRYQEAYAYLKEARSWAPNDYEVLKYLGFSAYHLGHYREAYRLLDTCLWKRPDPQDPYLYQYFALSVYERNKFRLAADFFERALLLAEAPELVKVLFYNLGNCYLALEDFEKAKLYYQKALEIDTYYLEAKKALKEVEKIIKDQK